MEAVFVYYIGTLENIATKNIFSNTRGLDDMNYLLEGNGIAAKLLQIVQVLAMNLRGKVQCTLSQMIKLKSLTSSHL